MNISPQLLYEIIAKQGKNGKVSLFFDGRGARDYSFQSVRVEFRSPVETEYAVLLLHHVGELRVAESADPGVVEKRRYEPFKAIVERLP